MSENPTPLVALESERALLGGILLTPTNLEIARDLVGPSDFADRKHELVFAAMLALESSGTPIDLQSLGHRLERDGVLAEVGGLAYLALLDSSVPVSADIARIAMIVRDRAFRRQLAHFHAESLAKTRAPAGETSALFEVAQDELAKIGSRSAATKTRSMRAMLKDTFDHIERVGLSAHQITGTPTGFESLDNMTSGLGRGDLVVLAGRPSMGKTALGLQIAQHVAVVERRPVVVMSYEMSELSLMLRLLASRCRIDHGLLRTGRLGEKDQHRLSHHVAELDGAPLTIVDRPLALMDVRALARRTKARLGDLGLVVVDYIQIMPTSDADNREQAIAALSRGLKALARDLDVPVLALSQLNRSLENRKDKRPQMSDLRESGAIEQDADLIAFVYRDEVYDKHSRDQGVAEIIIAKQRNGPTGTVRLAFQNAHTRFEDLR